MKTADLRQFYVLFTILSEYNQSIKTLYNSGGWLILNKKILLVFLLVIFMCACTLVNRDTNQDNEQESNEIAFLQQFDEIVEKATIYANHIGASEVQSVFQNAQDNIWKIEFENGLNVLYNEKNGEITHMSNPVNSAK
jgi:hypothetical protein